MKILKKAITLNVGLVLMGSAVFAQSLTDAKKAIDAEQYQKASSMLKSLVNSQASNGDNYYNLGMVYLKTGYIDSARVVFNKGVAADAKNASNYAGLGEADLLSNNPTSAKTNFDKAVSVNSKDYKTYLAIGKAYLAQDKPSDDVSKPDFANAITNLTKADELDSKDKDADVFIAIGDAYALQKKNSEALTPYFTVSSIDPTNRRAKTQVGKMYKESRAFAEGEKELQEVIAADPNYGPAYRELGELYLQWSSFGTDKEKAAKGVEYYKKYLDLTDKSTESQLRYMQFLFYAKDFPALEQVASSIKVPANDPKAIIVSRLKGWSAYENKNYPLALTNMTDYFAKQKDTSKILTFDYLYLGKAQLKAGQDSLALINITKAVEKDSTNADALSEVAKSLYDAKKYAKAAQVYEKAIKANPNGKGSLYNYYYNAMANYFDYGAKYSAKQNPSKDILVKADSAIAKVTQISPETYDAYLTRARINSLLDDDKDPKGLMVPYYEEFITKVTAKPEIATTGTYPKRLSEAYDTLGGFYFYKDKTKAKEYFDKSVAVYPSGTFAATKLKELAAPAPKGKGK
ncbi:tetratricopeptide repeat protein [Pedobacter lithocola]|uniref:Tetratricopeptide repeat protein n=1 Tax=Pedobacter lithocola TaxID=1908239 RepID=A0ABV8PBP7_9SPHI